MITMSKVTIRKAEWRDALAPDMSIWTASHTVGYSGNYEPVVRFFSSWADAYAWAYDWQWKAVERHLERVGLTYCSCGVCLRYGPRARRVNG